jgi:sigma-54 dependent transcriptional regulator, acetoin dehydrogenase operon transcriptional activator AcoR
MARLVQSASTRDAHKPNGERPSVVATWHDRARHLGLSEQVLPDFGSVTRAELTRLADQHRALYTHAVPVMEMLHEQIQNTHSMVVLTDAGGLILHALGDSDFLEKANRVALRPGVTWSEGSKGTNAIGTALTESRPTLVHGSEHFLTANRFLTCSCSPISDPHGRVIGTLDVSGAKESYHAHTMALVRMSTQMIENHLFVDRFSQAVRIHFHPRPEFLGTITEGIVAFDESGRFIAANRGAQVLLGLPPDELLAHTLPSLFGTTLVGLIDRSRTANPGLLSLCLHSGIRVSARAQLCAPATPLGVSATNTAGADSQDRGIAQSAPRPKGMYTLKDLDMGEPAVARVLERVRKVQRHEIPIMILGETGTGKEVLAQAIHNESHRSSKPFVAVDCASIPESLIEAELFGYEEGAFTGARRKGSHGKILMANGGTLFLDEIGDMPLPLQTRLLRVLQERTVTPLGSNKAVAVNIAVICATHRNVREMIQRGEFREDLYYRLNGLVVRLPALRDRCDIACLVERILDRECAVTAPLAVSDEVLSLFRQYRWPGNVRQLANVLRTAAVMAGDDGDTIQRHHLPDDFIEELLGEQLLAAHSCTNNQPVLAVEPLPTAPPETDSGSLKDLHAIAIRSALDQYAGNVSAAARSLGVSRNTIYRAMRATDCVETEQLAVNCGATAP